MLPTPVIIDCTDAAIEAFPNFEVIRDANGVLIALCPLQDILLSNGEFSYATDIQLAMNNFAGLHAFVKQLGKLDPVFAKGPEKDRIRLARELAAKAERR
jgi:hypothetical protein